MILGYKAIKYVNKNKISHNKIYTIQGKKAAEGFDFVDEIDFLF